MAPPPEYDKEPKAPDKTLTNNSSDDSKVLYNHIKDHQTNPDHKAVTAGANDVENNKHVETLDDGQLRALLDEAINYKCPKDREGKSSLFKNLLQEAEEQECEAATRGLGAGRGGRRGRGRREHHSSLQDLVAAIAGEAAPRRGRAHGHAHAHAAPPAASVSARAHHGGSLPSGVDKSFLLSEEASIMPGAARGGYLATVRCVNPPPLAERRVSAGDAAPEPAPEPPARPAPPPATPPATDDARRSKPMFPMTYTARATLEIGSGSVCSGRAVTTTTASNQVDSAIPFSCITTPEVVASCNTTSTTSTVAVDPKPRSVISSNFNGLPLVRPAYASTTSSNTDEYKKSLDENGNAVQGFNSPLSGSSQHKKPRRKKSSKNETIIKSQEIDGYQGNKDLNEVLRFIESHADGARAPKLRAKHHDDDKAAKKRSTERRKDKEPKLKRASSLEELSRTTLEELTAATPATNARVRAVQRGPPAPPKPERRSWGDAVDADPAPHELTDFQTVTKKRKPRRRADDAPDLADHADARPRGRPSAPPSAPASDRSNDSNDDMDSVTSLPAAPPPPPPPPPAPPLPHASYADIARTRHNIPDLIESCNYYAEGEGGEAGEVSETGEGVPPPPAAAAAPADAPQYPALALVRARARTARKAGKRKEPDVVADRRPAVILLDSVARPRELDGVTFGFDVNEQLLGGPACCDLLEHAALVAVRGGCAALRYVPPEPPPDSAHLHQIIEYVGTAWDDVVRCGGGKVRYFSE